MYEKEQDLKGSIIIIIIIVLVFNVGRLLLLFHPCDDLLCRIKNSVGLSPAGVAPLTLLVVLQCALLAEVVLALSHDRVDERLSAEEALEWQLFLV